MNSSPTDGTDGAEGRAGPGDVQALLSRALELRDAGNEDWLRLACAAAPELEGRVAELAERAHALPGIVARASALDSRIGMCLGGRFQLCERIGAGAMGVVYLARDRELRRNVACKVVRHGLMAPEKALERFEREARAMAVVQHPAVATIYDRGRTDDGQVYIVMELIDGVPLSDVLELVQRREERPRSDDPAWLAENFRIAPRDESSYLRTAVGWIADLALGLEAVHQAGVLHRDVKPSNILLRREGGPALLDFGIALLEDSDPITRGVTSLGTPSYMPPEALLPDVKRTPAGDVYGLAATLYHLVTLHAPYEGSPTQVLAALATREPIPAADRRPGLPRDLQAILDMGMHRDPTQRYASAAEFESDLRAFLEFRPIVARPVTRFERGLRRLVRSKLARGAAAALLAVLVLAGIAAWREHHLDVRRAQHAELARHFPPNFSVVGLANRGFLNPADQRALTQLLDAAAEVAVDPLPTFLLRASDRQDRGDAEGAAQDMRVVADDVATPFARELAARYGSAAPETIGIASIDLDGLPETSNATDRYLLAYHLLRQLRGPEAIELLSDDEVRRIAHAEELFLASTDFEDLPLVERKRLGVQRYADLVRLEGRIGQRTATTAHIGARMLVLQGRFDEAEPLAEEGVELAPRSHVLRVNAGWAAFGERHLAEAREHLRVARELRPNYEKPLKEAIWVEIADRRFDEAQRLVREAGPELQPASTTWSGYWTGVVLTYAALDARAAGDEAECERRVQEALRSFATARKRTHDKDDKPKDVAFGIATALTDRDEEALVLCLARLVAEQPTNWWRLSVFATHLPQDLSAEATAAVRQIFDALGVRSLPTASK